MLNSHLVNSIVRHADAHVWAVSEEFAKRFSQVSEINLGVVDVWRLRFPGHHRREIRGYPQPEDGSEHVAHNEFRALTSTQAYRILPAAALPGVPGHRRTGPAGPEKTDGFCRQLPVQPFSQRKRILPTE